MGISLVINTLNEERHIEGCIRSAASIVDEIIVVDMRSDDRTAEIAKSLGAKIFLHERTGYAARQFAVSKAAHEWILILDADERMTEKLAQRLTEVALENKHDLVFFGSLFNYFGAYVRHGGFFYLKWPRFFKRDLYLSSYRESDLIVHRDFTNVERATQKPLQLSQDYFILHDAYPTIEKYISKTVGMYARIEAEEMVKKGNYKFSFLMMMFEPMKSFVGKFFFRGGFRDGIRGLILAYFFASYRFSIWAHIWFIEQQASKKSGANDM